MTNEIIKLVDFKRDSNGDLENCVYNIEYDGEWYKVIVMNGYVDVFYNGVSLATL